MPDRNHLHYCRQYRAVSFVGNYGTEYLVHTEDSIQLLEKIVNKHKHKIKYL